MLKITRLIYGVIAAMAIMMVAGCGSHKEAVPIGQVSPSQQSVATYVFGEAAKQYSLNNHDEAFSLVRQTLKINPRHTGALALLAQYEAYLRNIENADSLLTLALDIAPTDRSLLEMYAMLCNRMGISERTLDAYARLCKAYPRNKQALSRLAQLYAQSGESDSAIVTLNRLENLSGMSENISNLKYVLYLEKADTVSAINELRALVNEYPSDPNYAVLLGNAYSRVLNEPDSANAIFDKVQHSDPTNGRLQLARLNLYQIYDSAHYNTYFDSLLYSPVTDSELRVNLALRFVSQHHADSVGRHMINDMFNRILDMPQENSRMLTTYASYLTTIKASNDTLRPVLQRLIEKEPSNRVALLQLLQIHLSDMNSAEVGRVCDQAITYYSHEPVFYYYSALGHYLDGDTLVALDRLTVGCEHINDETDIEQAADMWQMQGDMLYKLKRKDEAYAAYDSCLTYKPDHILCLNNYAYYLSLDSARLDEAERMSYRTLRIKPNDRTYLDTYAWILYMQQRYNEAAQQMDKVMEGIEPETVTDEPDDVSADVFDHAGDIYAANGDYPRALLFWQAAERLGCTNKELKRKLRNK